MSILITITPLIMISGLFLSSVAYACSGNCEAITNTPTVVVTLNGTDQTISYPLTFSLNNTATGGWHISISSTQFATASTPVHMLPASFVAGVTSVCQVGQNCTADPKNSITYPIGVPVMPNSAPIYDSQANTGIGTFDVTATLNLTVPANAYRGIYNSTVTLTLSDGP